MSSCSWAFTKLLMCLGYAKNVTVLTSDATKRTTILTSSQCQIIRRSWKICYNQTVVQKVFLTILLKNYKVREIFQLHLVPDALLVTNERFVNHARRFGMFMDICVSHLKLNPQRIAVVAQDVGQKHVGIRWVNFDAEYWLLFKSAIIDCVVDELKIKDSSRLREAWNKFLMFVLSEIKTSFLQTIKHQNSRLPLEQPREALVRDLVNELAVIKRSLSTLECD